MLCVRVRRLLSAYHDAELPAERRSAVRRHLQGCAACRSRLDHFKNLAELTAQWSELNPAASLWVKLGLKIRSACESAAADEIAPLTDRCQKLPASRRTFKPSLEGLEDRYALADLLGASAAVMAPGASATAARIVYVESDCSASFHSTGGIFSTDMHDAFAGAWMAAFG